MVPDRCCERNQIPRTGLRCGSSHDVLRPHRHRQPRTKFLGCRRATSLPSTHPGLALSEWHLKQPGAANSSVAGLNPRPGFSPMQLTRPMDFVIHRLCDSVAASRHSPEHNRNPGHVLSGHSFIARNSPSGNDISTGRCAMGPVISRRGMTRRFLIPIGSRTTGMNPDSGRQQSPRFRNVR